MELTIKNFKCFGDKGVKIDLAPITFITGENSSGKSSLTKAILLIQDFMNKSKQSNGINNSNIDFSKYNLDGFDGSLNKKSTSREICFSFKNKLDIYNKTVQVTYYFIKQDKDILNRGWLDRMTIINEDGDTIYSWNSKDKSKCFFNAYLLVNPFFNFVEKFLNGEKSDNFKDVFEKDLKDFKHKDRLSFALKNHLIYDFNFVLNLLNKTNNEVIDYINNSIIDYPAKYILGNHPVNYDKLIELSNKIKETGKNILEYLIEEQNRVLKNIIPVSFFFEPNDFNALYDLGMESRLFDDISSIGNEFYTGTLNIDRTFTSKYFKKFIDINLDELALPNILSESVLIKATDSTTIDIIRSYADTIVNHSMYGNVYSPNTFLNKWLKQLGIADELVIKNIEHDNFNLYLKSNDEIKPVSYEGLGIIKLVQILLQIETAIIKAHTKISVFESFEKFNLEKQSIVIEEPESHLHPKLQSLLCDIIYDAYKNYNIHFIIETHSEYLIRKSQVFVSEMGFKSNTDSDSQSPFRTYYLPKNGEIYSLGYRKDGKFINKFGEGFFDEASKLVFKIL